MGGCTSCIRRRRRCRDTTDVQPQRAEADERPVIEVLVGSHDPYSRAATTTATTMGDASSPVPTGRSMAPDSAVSILSDDNRSMMMMMTTSGTTLEELPVESTISIQRMRRSRPVYVSRGVHSSPPHNHVSHTSRPRSANVQSNPSTPSTLRPQSSIRNSGGGGGGGGSGVSGGGGGMYSQAISDLAAVFAYANDDVRKSHSSQTSYRCNAGRCLTIAPTPLHALSDPPPLPPTLTASPLSASSSSSSSPQSPTDTQSVISTTTLTTALPQGCDSSQQHHPYTHSSHHSYYSHHLHGRQYHVPSRGTPTSGLRSFSGHRSSLAHSLRTPPLLPATASSFSANGHPVRRPESLMEPHPFAMPSMPSLHELETRSHQELLSIVRALYCAQSDERSDTLAAERGEDMSVSHSHAFPQHPRSQSNRNSPIPRRS